MCRFGHFMPVRVAFLACCHTRRSIIHAGIKPSMLLAPLVVLAVVLLVSQGMHQTVYAEPIIHDENLALEVYMSGFCCRLTGMEFLADGDILVLQKNGHVRLVRDGQLLNDSVLVIDTVTEREMGLLGIARHEQNVYLYYTVPDEQGNPVLNRIERYMWDGQSLRDPVVVLELPANLYHNGGTMVTGPDGQVYAVIGDTGRYGPLQNKDPGSYYPPDMIDYLDTSAILRVDPPGPYYAIGIRNSFGIAFDPVTGIMWDTENGDDDSDEINMVYDGFNSGWEAVMGMATESELADMAEYGGYEYQDPKFTWYLPVAPTGIGFADFAETDMYGDAVFVGDCNHGRLYMFTMNQNRDGFVFSSAGLQDTVADYDDSLEEIIVAEGLGCVTNIRTGPDGYLYITSYSHDAIYRVLPASAVSSQPDDTEPVSPSPPQPSPQAQPPDGAGGCLIATAAYGTELAPQVQALREIRDDMILPTESGAAFMSVFGAFYYSFSPGVADLEREHPVLRDIIRVAITPMIHSLSLMGVADGASEWQVILLGTIVVSLNVILYIVMPAVLFHKMRRIVHNSGSVSTQFHA